MFFVVLGALFTATTQTIVPRRDLTTLSGTRVASVLTLMPVATLLSISNRFGRPGSGGACAWRVRSCMTTPVRRSAQRGHGPNRARRQDQAHDHDDQGGSDLNPDDPAAAQPGQDDLSDTRGNYPDDDQD
jgi:hypothetical protein